MNINWIETGDIYRQIIAEPDMTAKQQLYRDGFGSMFKAMRESAPYMPASDDVLETARTFNFVMPEDLTDTPDALAKLEAADVWTVGKQALREGVTCFAPYADRLTVDEITGWLLLADPAKADPSNRGYTGFQFPGHIVGIFDTPNDYNLARVPGLVVHELHHIIRLGLFPWTMTQPYGVADYVVLEGMAESFAAQLYGPDVVGYYATDITPEHLETARGLVRDGLSTEGDIRGYIFGDHLAERSGFQPIGMPPFGGYAVGYQMVQAYLKRTGKSVEEATFLPADEIVAESQYLK